jgi:hypothetical protein
MSEFEPTIRNTFYKGNDPLVKKVLKTILVMILIPIIITYHLITYLLFSMFPKLYFYSSLFMRNALLFFKKLPDYFYTFWNAFIEYIIIFTKCINILYNTVSKYIGRFINNGFLFLNNCLSKLLSFFLQLYNLVITFLDMIYKFSLSSINFIYRHIVNNFINKYSKRIWDFFIRIVSIIFQLLKESMLILKSLLIQIGHLIRRFYSLSLDFLFENFYKKIIYNLLLLKGFYLIKTIREILGKFILINLLRFIQFLEKFIVGYLFKIIQIYLNNIYYKLSEFIKNLLDIMLTYIDTLLGILIEKYNKIKNSFLYLIYLFNNMILSILEKALSIFRKISHFLKTFLLFIGKLIEALFNLIISSINKLLRLIKNAIFITIEISYEKLTKLLMSLYLCANIILDKLGMNYLN